MKQIQVHRPVKAEKCKTEMWWNSIRNPLETFGAFEMVALKVFGFETPIFRGAPQAVNYAAPQQDAWYMTSVAFQTTSMAKQTVSVTNIRTRGGPEIKKNSCRAEADNDSSNAWAMQVGCNRFLWLSYKYGFFFFATERSLVVEFQGNGVPLFFWEHSRWDLSRWVEA